MKRFIDAQELADEWGISRAYAYVIIRKLNDQLQEQHPGTIIISGKLNRKYYEEVCNAGEIMAK